MAEGDYDYGPIWVAVVISEYGYPYFTDGKIVGNNASDADITMCEFEDLFEEYHYAEKWMNTKSDEYMKLSVDYVFPFYHIWNDEEVFQNRPIIEKKNVSVNINYEDFEIEKGVLTKYKRFDDKVVIPENVVKIGAKAFIGSLRGVTILSGVEEIGDDAFYDQNSLIKITLPDSLTKIGDRAFKRCALRKLIIPNSVKSIGKESFSGCRMEQINIPENVTEIGEGAFAHCGQLQKAVIHGNITEVKDNTFYWCYNLVEVNLSESVTKIGYGAFNVCNLLHTINIPSNVIEIGKCAFTRCRLQDISIPRAIIGESAFAQCEILTNVKISNGARQIGKNAFYGCRSLKSVIIPESVISIADDTFEDCKKLTIRCTKGSYAEEYAKSHGIRYSIM